ncbi:M16 family metallopeptidase [Limisalsivibrio acetivorans]|uniref:M16 family metallopeptidase n=1 Tax=Limisalsivibrio acetivorans TaxID=1304888 RepID=UPI0003B4B1F8|nr:pitrilysin family protein [Limisalsivibrio acetivorans]
MNASVERFELKNGIDVVYRNMPDMKVASVQVWMKTGAVNENDKNNGISHFLEHMVFKGTKSFEPGDIDRTVESSGGSMNAATSKDYTFYYITMPSKNAETAFNVLSEMLFDAKFLPEEIEKEKPVVVQEIKRKFDRPTYDMWVYLYRELFKSSPYEREVIGTEENVLSFTREQLLDYYNHYYHPENMTLVIAGDMDKKEALKLAVKYFERDDKEGAGSRYSGEANRGLQGNIVKTFERGVSQEYGVVAYPAPDVETDMLYSFEVLSEIIAGGEFSVLNSKLKHELGIVNSINAGYLGLKHGGSFIFTYTCSEGKSDEVVRYLDSFIPELGEYIGEKSIERAKNRLKSQTAFQRERSSSEARDIGYSYTLGIPAYYHDFLEKISSVESGDILKAANKVFSGKYIDVRTLPGG